MAVSQEQEAMHRVSDPGILTSNFFSTSAQLPTFVHTCFSWDGQERLTSSEEGWREGWISELRFDGLVYD